jgi:hypothetical protein
MADRWGGMRARWDGYAPGDEKTIEEVARKFLAEQAPPSTEAATVLRGAGLLRITWLRETPAAVTGLTMLEDAAGGEKILASVGRTLTIYEEDGQSGRVWDTGFKPGRLRASADGTEEGYRVISFRPGSSSLFIFEMAEGTHEEWRSPSPVFDALLLPPGGKAAALVATYDGLLRATVDGGDLSGVDDFSGVAALRATESGVIALEFEGRLSWLDRSLALGKRVQSLPDGWSLLVPERGEESVGVLPVGVSASAVGRFLEEEGMQIAAATESGHLVIVDHENGAELFRAEWPGIEDMAAGDLDGDGLDELILAAGSRIVALTAQSRPSAATTD